MQLHRRISAYMAHSATTVALCGNSEHGHGTDGVFKAAPGLKAPWLISHSLGATDRRMLINMMRRICKSPQDMSNKEAIATHLQGHADLSKARIWRWKQTLRSAAHTKAMRSKNGDQIGLLHRARLSRAKRCQLDSLKRLATNISEQASKMVRGVLDSHIDREAIHCGPQQTKTTTVGLKNSSYFMAIAPTLHNTNNLKFVGHFLQDYLTLNSFFRQCIHG